MYVNITRILTDILSKIATAINALLDLVAANERYYAVFKKIRNEKKDNKNIF